MRCRRLLAFAISISSCALLLVLPQSAPAHRPQPVAVALGDSYASGLGGRWLGNPATGGGPSAFGMDRACGQVLAGACSGRRVYLPGADGAGVACGRSDVAPIRSAPLESLAAANLACAGAVVRDLGQSARSGGAAGLPSQVVRLGAIAADRPVAFVVLSVGGNDLGFSRLIRDCALAWVEARVEGCRGRATARVEAALPGVRRSLLSALQSIKRTVRTASPTGGRAPVIVQGYPSPLPPGSRLRWGQGDPRRFLPGGCPFADGDADWISLSFTRRIGAALERVAAQAGVGYLDLSQAFVGHEACAVGTARVASPRPDPAKAEWVRQLVSCCGREVSESLHPNGFGQRAIGDCLALAWRRILRAEAGPWRCLSTPGAGPASMRLTGRSG